MSLSSPPICLLWPDLTYLLSLSSLAFSIPRRVCAASRSNSLHDFLVLLAARQTGITGP
jgi:hypothetical protein